MYLHYVFVVGIYGTLENIHLSSGLKTPEQGLGSAGKMALKGASPLRPL